MLVGDARSLDTEFCVNAVTILGRLEEFFGLNNGSGIRVLGIMDTLCLR